MKTNKYRAVGAAFLMSIVFSGAALAARHHYQAIGEGYGHDRDQAYEAASYYAYQACYLGWGESTQEETILVEEFQPTTGYWYVKLAQGCFSDD
ncbi:hypothetical protein [Lysobacter enzymogenes]|uniref:hypothetical protein n=1 Tax=Lysobacter enzymogenes TaxID=69 RepID=UPI0008986E84|nr:hypothetical protein [Lysobacter enzymogenes]SDX97411.1 hypothetical protein SAMN05421681_109221 [Lysobacter enzymogenes]